MDNPLDLLKHLLEDDVLAGLVLLQYLLVGLLGVWVLRLALKVAKLQGRVSSKK